MGGLPAFVISVGNLVVGGTGKTPLTLRLSPNSSTLGWNPAIPQQGLQEKRQRNREGGIYG